MCFRKAQRTAALPANAEIIFMYSDIGRMIAFCQAYAILPQSVAKLVPQPEALTRLVNPEASAIVPQPVARFDAPTMPPIVQRSVAQIPRATESSSSLGH